MADSWKPITDYQYGESASLSDLEISALADVWIERRRELGNSPSLKRFNERIKREWAVETGLVERLYDLDEGITKVLIERGIEAAVIPHRADSEFPGQASALISDQKAAVDFIFDYVKGERPLSTSFVKELHRLFTRNQQFAEGRDQFGRRTQVALLRGTYKKRPNNPTRPDGIVHYYCPPVHVNTEMDRLIALHRAHTDVTPEVEAAWLHHRFTQIHPFQDGNGRVARALATLVFVEAGWFPLVVRNRDRNDYMDALEAADKCDLKPLVQFFSDQQKKEFLRAIEIAKDVEKTTRADVRIDSIRRRLAKSAKPLRTEWDAVRSVADGLHSLAAQRLETLDQDLSTALREFPQCEFFVDKEQEGGERSHYWKRQVVSTAKQLEYYANMSHYRAWVRLCLSVKHNFQANILISIHGIGHDFLGVLVCSATWYLRTQNEEGKLEPAEETPLNDRIFQFTFNEQEGNVRDRFERWLEPVVERALIFWEHAMVQ